MNYYTQRTTASVELLALAIDMVDESIHTVFIRSGDMPDETVTQPKWTRCIKAAMIYLEVDQNPTEVMGKVEQFTNGTQLSINNLD